MKYEGNNYEHNIYAHQGHAFKTGAGVFKLVISQCNVTCLIKLSDVAISKLFLNWKYNYEDQKKAEKYKSSNTGIPENSYIMTLMNVQTLIFYISCILIWLNFLF